MRRLKHIADECDFVILFSVRYDPAFHGARFAAQKAVLVPTAEREAALGLEIFKPVFRGVRAIMYNSFEERALITTLSSNAHVPGVVVGVGSRIPAAVDPDRARRTFGLDNPFIIYVGRIDANKGCAELFRQFREYADRSSHPLDLVLIGTPVLPIPDHPRIRHLGFVADQDKFDAIAAAEALVMPSPYESLSMVALEAWALGRPVLATARCDVLVGQCLRSNAGLYYEDAREFGAALDLLLADRDARCHARQQRASLLRATLQLAGDRAQVSRHVRQASTHAVRAPHGAAAGLARAPGEDGPAGRRRRERLAAGSGRRIRPAVLRLLATPRAAAIGEPVKFAFITPRYGADVGTGAEHACRLIAEQVMRTPRRGRADDVRARSPHVEERVFRRRRPREGCAGPTLRRHSGAGPYRLRHAVAAPADGSTVARRGTRMGAPPRSVVAGADRLPETVASVLRRARLLRPVASADRSWARDRAGSERALPASPAASRPALRTVGRHRPIGSRAWILL